MERPLLVCKATNDYTPTERNWCHQTSTNSSYNLMFFRKYLCSFSLSDNIKQKTTEFICEKLVKSKIIKNFQDIEVKSECFSNNTIQVKDSVSTEINFKLALQKVSTDYMLNSTDHQVCNNYNSNTLLCSVQKLTEKIFSQELFSGLNGSLVTLDNGVRCSSNFNFGEYSDVSSASYDFKTLNIENSSYYGWIFLFAIIFILAGGLGNLLVCLAVALDRKLQNVTNYFLFSLAIADLLVSLFVMPLGAVQGFFGYWPFGWIWCNIYVTCDVLACSASILHMCFISLSRYIGIQNPLKSRHHSTKRLASIKIVLVWLIAMLISSSITILGIINRANIMPEPKNCSINNRVFFVFGSLLTFYIPMFFMLISYALTIKLLNKKARFAAEHPQEGNSKRLDGRFSVKPCRSGPANTKSNTFTYLNNKSRNIEENIDNNPLSSISGKLSLGDRVYEMEGYEKQSLSDKSINLKNQELNKSYEWKISDKKKSYKNFDFKRDSIQPTKQSALHNFYSQDVLEVDTTEDEVSRRSKLHSLKLSFNNFTPPVRNLSLRFLSYRSKKSNLSANAVATEQKATKVLGIVFFTFVLCWSPFFILNIIFVAFPNVDVPENIVYTCLWLGYVSSTINPIIYTIFNKIFRAAFIRLLKCNCERIGRVSRLRSMAERRGTTGFCAPSTLPMAMSLHEDSFFSSQFPTPAKNLKGQHTETDEKC